MFTYSHMWVKIESSPVGALLVAHLNKAFIDPFIKLASEEAIILSRSVVHKSEKSIIQNSHKIRALW